MPCRSREQLQLYQLARILSRWYFTLFLEFSSATQSLEGKLTVNKIDKKFLDVETICILIYHILRALNALLHHR
jgi:hypothetical protein